MIEIEIYYVYTEGSRYHRASRKNVIKIIKIPMHVLLIKKNV